MVFGFMAKLQIFKIEQRTGMIAPCGRKFSSIMYGGGYSP
jgi:hypothetical protein